MITVNVSVLCQAQPPPPPNPCPLNQSPSDTTRRPRAGGKAVGLNGKDTATGVDTGATWGGVWVWGRGAV